MGLNINNHNPREIVCNREEKDNNLYPNCHLLKKDKTYHLSAFKVYGWHTEVFLAEFPDKIFNSVQFDEVKTNFPSKLQIVEKSIKGNGRSSKTIAVMGNRFPDLFLSGEYPISLSAVKNKLEQMKIGDVFTIGRNADCDIILPHLTVFSRIHCYIVREEKSKWVLKDASLNGTVVSI